MNKIAADYGLGALAGYGLDDRVQDIEPCDGGHINDTYVVRLNEPKNGTRFILQRVNTYVFKNPVSLMNNIQAVTGFLREKIKKAGGNPDRETLTLLPAIDGKCYYTDADGEFWRMYLFVEGTECYNAARNTRDFYECGRIFGMFQYMLSDFPASALADSIPDFHNTAKRYEAFHAAVDENTENRVTGCAADIAFALEREAGAAVHVNMLESGLLPLRVTHNDTKLNNVLMDAGTGEAVCVVDLDTVMPGLAVNDFGDAIRYGANTTAEDEQDLTKVKLDLNYFKNFAQGFLKGSGGTLTAVEIDNLAAAARLMTLECGVRFLTDHLRGDRYFKIHRENHNLDRARNQFALVRDMEYKMDAMKEIINNVKEGQTYE